MIVSSCVCYSNMLHAGTHHPGTCCCWNATATHACFLLRRQYNSRHLALGRAMLSEPHRMAPYRSVPCAPAATSWDQSAGAVNHSQNLQRWITLSLSRERQPACPFKDGRTGRGSARSALLTQQVCSKASSALCRAQQAPNLSHSCRSAALPQVTKSQTPASRGA